MRYASGVSWAAKLAAVAFALALVTSAEAAVVQIEIVAAPGHEAAARRLKSVAKERIDAINAFIGPAAASITVTVSSTSSPLAAAVPPWAAGYALPSAGVVVLFPERNPPYPDDSLEETYLHELAHVLIHRASGGGTVPRWFHEGVATVAGRGWTLDDWWVFAVETLISGTPSQHSIDAMFGRDAGAARQAYVLSGRFIRDLTQKYGETVVRDLLADMKRGDTFEEAFFDATLLTSDNAWRKFRAGEMQSGRLIPILTSSFLLWLLISFIAIAAIVRRRKRDTLQTKLWELEEELADTPTELGDTDEGDPDERPKRDEWVN